MPIYEYVCQDCQNTFEMIRSIKDADAETQCLNCNGSKIQRKLSLFNASSSGKTLTNNHSCSGCSGGTCSSCGS